MSQHLLFDAANLELALPAGLVKGVHDTLEIQPVACSRPWFLGLSVAGGRLLPVTDLGAFAGRRHCSGRLIELEPSAGIAAIRVDRVYSFSDSLPIGVSEEKNENGDARECNLPVADQIIVDNHRRFRILDIIALIQSPAFIEIKDFEDG
ncbi:MAG: chemotaxis protein CheW [Granulosicoccus sp.]